MDYQSLMQYINSYKHFTPEEEEYLINLIGNKEYFKDIIITPNIVDLLSDDKLYRIDNNDDILNNTDLLLTILHTIHSMLAFLIAINEDGQYHKLPNNNTFNIGYIYEEYNNYVQEHGIPQVMITLA